MLVRIVFICIVHKLNLFVKEHKNSINLAYVWSNAFFKIGPVIWFFEAEIKLRLLIELFLMMKNSFLPATNSKILPLRLDH